MSARKLLGSLFVSAMFAMSASAMAKSGTIDFQKEIKKLDVAVDGAQKAGQINLSEKASLKNELAEIKKLYKKYIKDKTISSKESQALSNKLKKSDLNLFRKKYD